MNTFKPYFIIMKGRKSLNDWFQFHIYWCNYIGICFSIYGYGLNIGATLHDPKTGFNCQNSSNIKENSHDNVNKS